MSKIDDKQTRFTNPYLGHDNDCRNVRKYRFDITPSFGSHQPNWYCSGVSSSIPHRYPELKCLTWNQHSIQVHVCLTTDRSVWGTRKIFYSYHIATKI